MVIFSQLKVRKINSEISESISKREELEKKKENAFIEVSFLNVKGDSIFINYSDKFQVLIDGGFSKNAVVKQLYSLMPTNDKKIELVILTHKHQDHFNGFPAVFSNFKIDRFVKNYSEVPGALREPLDLQDIVAESYWAGESIGFDELFQIDFLSPNKEKIDFYGYDEDNKSLISKITFGKNKFLFMGDAENIAEKEMIERNVNLKANFLKVGHHGYSLATSDEFLSKVLPSHSIILSGHSPSNTSVIERLEKIGSKVYNLKGGTETEHMSVKCFYNQKDCEIQTSGKINEEK